MKLAFAHGRLPTRQMAGAALLAIASVLAATHILSAVPSPDSLSAALLAIGGVIALAVSTTRQGFTSLIGLFFLTTAVFNLARPILWLLFRDERVYELPFGIMGDLGSKERSEILLFWCVGIAAFAGGYFAFYRQAESRLAPLSQRYAGFCRRCFWMTLVIVGISIPLEAASKLGTFIREGYAGLYAGQTTYSLSWLRSLNFLLPVLFGLAVLLRESRYIRLVALAVTSYAVAGLIVGQRAMLGQWVLVAVWYLSVVRRKPIKRWLLVCAGTVLIILFQFIAGWRDGYGSVLTLTQFMVDQGVTFLLPASISQLPSPPPHSVVASLVPLGAVYSLFGIGTPADRDIGNYLMSRFNFTGFHQGYGLGATFYLELFYACGGLWLGYLLACALGGFVLRRWEESSSRRNVPLFYLCMCVSDIVFLPRGSISAVTPQIIYPSVYLVVVYAVDWAMLNCAAGVRLLPVTRPETTAQF